MKEFYFMQKSENIDFNKLHYFENESIYKIGAITYLTVAHFDNNREHLKTKITTLLLNDVSQNINYKLD
jgi:hypothetical protein